jgi:hypothetical protein
MTKYEKQRFREIHFLRKPWGGVRVYFSEKKKVHEKTSNIDSSTQFFMLIPNIILVLTQSVVCLTEIY